jgi:hypothetical protein
LTIKKLLRDFKNLWEQILIRAKKKKIFKNQWKSYLNLKLKSLRKMETGAPMIKIRNPKQNLNLPRLSKNNYKNKALKK